MKITFLSASVPLTKSYTKHADGTIEKTSYPNVWEVTSHEALINDLSSFKDAIEKHAVLGNCLLKGNVLRPLTKESRKDSTDRNATTDWLCLDIDGISPTYTVDPAYPPMAVTVDVVMEALGLKDVSYIVQWSGSMGIGGNTLRCHIFIMLTKPISAPLVKQWLIQKNHEVSLLRDHQALTKTSNSLTWGLDITACQADKLIYIAPPTLKGIKNPLGRIPRISLISKKEDTYDLTGKINSTDQNRALTDARVLELRDRDGLPKRKLVYKHVGGHEIMVKPGECIATETKTDRGFVYFNLNGGDSWAYFHPENNPDYIFNFKGEPVYLTKELLPAYWESLSHQAYRVASNGITYLAFLERSTSTYYRGTYDAANEILDIYPAKNESMVRQFADANGLRLGPNIPEWDMEFNPTNGVTVDFQNQVINTFERTEYMKTPYKKVTKIPPTCAKVISHILCDDSDTVDHFINWLACIAQNLDRTRTAWVFQGIPGTGKGLLFNKILQPLFGEKQTVIKRAGELTEKWTDFVQGKFIVFIDEIQTSALRDEAGVIANMKNLITEPTAMIRVMNRNSFAVMNYTNWLFASNKPDPVSVDKNDRRFNVAPYQGVAYPRPTDDELEVLKKELQAFYHYLITYPVDKHIASTPLQSDARNELIELSQTTSESTADALREGNMQFFIDQLPTSDAYKLDMKLATKVESYRRALCDILVRIGTKGYCNIRRDELFSIFDHTVGGMSTSPATFSRFLGHKQISIKPIQIPGGKTERGITVTWDGVDPALILKAYFSDMTKTTP
jgi:hypothetical protein